MKTTKAIIIATFLLNLLLASCNEGEHASMNYDFNAERKDATTFTEDFNNSFYDKLNFGDTSDFANANRGLIAPLPNDGDIEGIIQVSQLQFMQNKKAPSTVNPSLWRHAQLVNRGGLYEVLPDKVYQVRGQDVSNLTILETKNGIILYDLCYSPKTFEKSMELYEKHRGKRKLKGIIISHSHLDHYGGITGVVNYGLATEEDFKTGRVPVYVPEGFVDEAASENAIFGNIMSRRATYQYGYLLEKDEKGLITGALGPAVAAGDNGLPKNVVEITPTNTKVSIDGINFEFLLAPETEAPVEMLFFIPEWNAFSGAEDVNQLQHNVYTMRGAKIRNAGVWGKYLNEALARWGSKMEVQFGPHTWPSWGNENVVAYVQNQADLYQAMFNQVAKMANEGNRPHDIAENINISDEILNAWENRGYYGDFQNNVIATYVYNLGWFNANIAELAKHVDSEAGKRYVDVIGGEQRVLEKALGYFEKGDYRFVVDLLSNVVAYNAENQKVNFLLADAFEQLGYQRESSLARNWFLSSARELREGGGLPAPVNSAGIDVLTALPSELVLMYMADLVDADKAKGKNYAVALKLNEDNFELELAKGILRYKQNYRSNKATSSVEIDNLSLFAVMSGQAKLNDLVKSGKVKVTGNQSDFEAIIGVLNTKQQNKFNLILPNK